MQLYTNSVQDRYGNALKGAQITVRTAAGVLATLYADNGVTLVSNPLTADATGEFRFYAANGRYTFTVTASGMQAEIVSAFEMYDAIELKAEIQVIANSAGPTGAAAAQTVVNTLNNRLYPGVSATDPLTRPDGTTRQLGDEYFNSATSRKMVFRATGWLDFELNASNSATASEASRQASATQAGISTTQAGLAATAKTGADAARDAALIQAGVYTTEALGRAAVVDGAAFKVQGSGEVAAYEYRRIDSTASTLIASYPSVSAVKALQSVVLNEYTDIYAYTIRDAGGRVAFGVKLDGTVVAVDLAIATINGLTTTAISASMVIAQLALDKTASFSTLTGVAPVYTINDAAGRTVLEIAADGTISVSALRASTINGGNALTMRPSYGGTFDSELVYFTNTGQSLSSGPAGAITKAQEYDNIGFPNGVDNTAAPTAYLPLTAANCSQTGDAEPPIFGALGNIKALLAQENGIAYTAQKYQLLATDNSHGSYAITALKKGQALYNEAIAQTTSAKAIANTENRTFTVGGVFWTQGEADSANGYAYYLATLKQLATDYNTDFKAVTGQSKDIHFVTYQTGSSSNTDVARAQLQASLDLPNLIHMACPMYQFDYQSDGVHINSDSSKWLGGYYGLVYKRVAIDGVTWSPTRPVSAFVQDKFANVKFNLMVRPLVLDTALIQAQANSGFTLVDSAGNNLPLSSVTVSGPDTIKVVATSAIPAGAKLRYGYNTAIGKGGYIRGCGNLRDSQGEIATYYNHPLHNWCVFFEFQIS